MRKFMNNILIGWITLCCLTTTVAHAANEVVVTNRGWVSVHASPSIRSASFGKLDLGHQATLIKVWNKYWYEVSFNGRTGFITTDSALTHIESASGGSIATNPPAGANQPIANPKPAPEQPPTSPSSGGYQTVVTNIHNLPPDVTYDTSITPVAPLSATWTQKETAVLNVAAAQIGTPYVWGTSKDRGQDSFDCSNFTAYVYHHALGYDMSGASQIQAKYVGWSVPQNQLRVGDLMIFENGAHVGIYAGNGQIIQCGGGLHRVGYLKYTLGSYWYNHLTGVKRMF